MSKTGRKEKSLRIPRKRARNRAKRNTKKAEEKPKREPKRSCPTSVKKRSKPENADAKNPKASSRRKKKFIKRD